MDKNQRISRTFRLQNHEIMTLEGTISFLSDKKKSLNIDKAAQENYQIFIEKSKEFIHRRDELLNELKEIAQNRYEMSERTDMSASLCLYLINQLKESEKINKELEEKYIDSKYDPKKFLIAELAYNKHFPKSLNQMKVMYDNLKNELNNAEAELKSKNRVLQLTKNELEGVRTKNRESERTVPETTRIMLTTYNDLTQQFQDNEKKISKLEKELNEKKMRYEKRNELIDKIIHVIHNMQLQKQENTLTYKIFNELKLILQNISSSNRSKKFYQSRIQILKRALIQKKNISPNQETRTPDAMKMQKPLLTPEEIRQRLHQYHSAGKAQYKFQTPNNNGSQNKQTSPELSISQLLAKYSQPKSKKSQFIETPNIKTVE